MEEKQPLTEDTIQHKCKKCGGIMAFSPSVGALVCTYCGCQEEANPGKVEVKENDYEYWASNPQMMQTEQTLQAEVKCKQCGATTTFPPDVSSFKCAFCGSPIVLSEAVQQRSWTPEYILPFKVDKKQCDAFFAKWVKSLWFLPNGMKQKNKSDEQFKGVYLPYWTYDAATRTTYVGERGVNRKVTEKGSDGKTQTRTVTDWYPAFGTVQRDFDDVLVPASESLPKSISRVLTNWDKDNYVPYDPIYVKGFITEIYKQDFKASLPQAKEIMEATIDRDVRNDIGGDTQRVTSKDITYNHVTFKHVLLPLWTSAFRYKDKTYLFAINGRTGQVAGQRPYSAIKIALLVLVIVAILVLVFALNGGGGSGA